MKYLKTARLIISLSFFFLFLWLFLGLVPVNVKLAGTLTYLQVVPALVRWSAGVCAGLIALLVVAGMTLLAGRVYCSSLCPLGTLQDCAIKLKIQNSKFKSKYKKPVNWLRFGLPGLVFLAFYFGRIEPLMILDPYTEFGRIITEAIKPAAIAVNNHISYALGIYGVTAVRPAMIHFQNHGIMIFTAAALLLLLGFSFFRGRIFCNTLCPVGGLLGIVSCLSVFRLKLDDKKCNSCGLCGYVCKAECIDTANKKLDFSRCISCFNCVSVCNRGAVYYGTDFSVKKPVNEERREALRFMFSAAAAFFIYLSYVSKALAQGAGSLIPVIKKNTVIIPPGADSMKRFRELCTGCGLCVTACPTKVLTQAVKNRQGRLEPFQPSLDYAHAYCSYNCTVCTQVCPTGAIKELSVEAKRTKALGAAKFIKENCVVVTNGQPCVVCDEHCPSKAILLVKFKNDLSIPDVREHLCIGCGACEKTCPASPHKAIYVEGFEIHRTAEKPKGLGNKWKSEGDFPF